MTENAPSADERSRELPAGGTFFTPSRAPLVGCFSESFWLGVESSQRCGASEGGEKVLSAQCSARLWPIPDALHTGRTGRSGHFLHVHPRTRCRKNEVIEIHKLPRKRFRPRAQGSFATLLSLPSFAWRLFASCHPDPAIAVQAHRTIAVALRILLQRLLKILILITSEDSARGTS